MVGEVFGNCFCKNNGKRSCKIATIGGYSKSAAFTECKKFFKSRTVKHLLWVGRPGKFTKIFEGHNFALMRVHNFALSVAISKILYKVKA